MLNSNILNPSAKADGNKWLKESDFVHELPFTLVNGFMENKWLRGFNPILKFLIIFKKSLIQLYFSKVLTFRKDI